MKAVSEQAAKAAHVSNYFATEPQIKLAAKLVKLAGAPEGSRVYFGNSGAEGNEAALKLAKLYGRTLPGALPEIGGKPARIISMTHGFHGRTMGALSATWKPAIREKFEPLVPNIEFVEAGNVEALHDAFAETGQGKYGKGPVAAVIMELIQGEAGVMPLGADYVKAARKLCDEHKALLIIDEVQTGIGRTGAWFAFQREDLSGGVTPDIVTFAKGVGGGFPMGGMISFGAELSALFTPVPTAPLSQAIHWALRRHWQRWESSKRTTSWTTPKNAASSCATVSPPAVIRCSSPCVAVACSTPSNLPTPARMRP